MNEDLKTKIDELEELAKKATPGPWRILEHEIVKYTLKDGPIIGINVCRIADFVAVHENRFCDNARFIAAANPAVVLALIEKIERLEDDLEAAARSAAEESVEAVKLEEEADWLAQQASLMCDCIENCDECRLFSECGCNGQNSKEIWRKAAQEAIAEEEDRIKESEPDA